MNKHQDNIFNTRVTSVYWGEDKFGRHTPHMLLRSTDDIAHWRPFRGSASTPWRQPNRPTTTRTRTNPP